PGEAEACAILELRLPLDGLGGVEVVGQVVADREGGDGDNQCGEAADAEEGHPPPVHVSPPSCGACGVGRRRSRGSSRSRRRRPGRRRSRQTSCTSSRRGGTTASPAASSVVPRASSALATKMRACTSATSRRVKASRLTKNAGRISGDIVSPSGRTVWVWWRVRNRFTEK